MGAPRAAAEGAEHEEFHGARPVFGAHGSKNTAAAAAAAALDQTWQHVAHLCISVCRSSAVLLCFGMWRQSKYVERERETRLQLSTKCQNAPRIELEMF